MPKIKLLAVITLVMGVGLAFSITAITQEEVLTIGTTDRIPEVSPANSYDYWTWHTFQQTSDALLKLKPGETTPSPALAMSMPEVSEDGTVYTFRLKMGVTYTDGTPFNCKTMAWSLARNIYVNGPEGGVGLIGGIEEISCPPATLQVKLGEKPTPEELEDFLKETVKDPYTIKIKLSNPDATFLARMVDTLAPSIAISPESTSASEFAKGDYAGVGPYKLVEYVPEERTVYEAYDNYYGAQPKTPKVVEMFYADAAALRAAVEAGEVDVGFRTFIPDDIKDLEERADELGLKVTWAPNKTSLSVRYMVFTVNHPPFDNANLRRSISYSVCRNRLSDEVFAGLNAPLYSMVPTGLFSHIDAFPKRDLEKARELLKKEGYSEDNPFKMTLNYTPKHYGTEEADVAAVLKGCLEETGMIEVDIASYEWGTYIERESSAAFDVFLLGWYPDFIDPDNFLSPWLTESPQGLGTWLNKAKTPYEKEVYNKFVELIEEAKETTDREGRIKLYKEAQKLLAESVILLPLWSNSSQHVAITQENVKGVVLDASMSFRDWLIYKE